MRQERMLERWVDKGELIYLTADNFLGFIEIFVMFIKPKHFYEQLTYRGKILSSY